MIFKSCWIWLKICILSSLMMLNLFLMLFWPQIKFSHYFYLLLFLQLLDWLPPFLCFLFIWPPPRDPSIACLLLFYYLFIIKLWDWLPPFLMFLTNIYCMSRQITFHSRCLLSSKRLSAFLEKISLFENQGKIHKKSIFWAF